MTQTQKSSRNGVLKDETAEPPQVSQFTNAESPSTLDTLAFSAAASNQKASQLTPNSQEEANNLHVRMIMAFVGKLGKLVEVKKVTLGGGRKGWMIFFSATNWLVDPETKSLRAR